ncbi:MAG TPA: hypothetical protein VI547_06165 [Anaerolineales bacterium]|nr:hypothetical protein [Anaerolineales bacterium]
MTIILANYPLPEKGRVEININLSFEIKVTAEQAQRRVSRWLMEFVSTQMGAEQPTLVIDGERALWRVPAYIGFPHVGHAGIVGMIDVDVRTGEVHNTPEAQAEIEKRATEIARRQPPFKVQEAPAEYLAKRSDADVERKPDTGEVKVTAYQARKKVNYWLMEHISTQMGAEQPTLVETDRKVWRVPVHVSFPHVGTIGGVGAIDVDAGTGEMLDLAARQTEIEEYLEREVKPKLPLYQPKSGSPQNYQAESRPSSSVNVGNQK